MSPVPSVVSIIYIYITVVLGVLLLEHKKDGNPNHLPSLLPGPTSSMGPAEQSTVHGILKHGNQSPLLFLSFKPLSDLSSRLKHHSTHYF